MTARERAGRLAGFAILAAFASYHWFALIADPPLWRWAVCVAVALACGGRARALARINGRRPVVVVLAIAAGRRAVRRGRRRRGARQAARSGLRGESFAASSNAGLAGISQAELAVRGARAVDASGDPARGATRPHGGGALCVLAVPVPRQAPARGRAGAPDRALRAGRHLGVAELGARPRVRPPALHRGVRLARAPAGLEAPCRGGGGGDRRPRGPSRGRARGQLGSAHQLRELERVRRRADRELRLGPQLRAARLAAARDRALRGARGRRPAVLEDGRAGGLRRGGLVPRRRRGGVRRGRDGSDRAGGRDGGDGRRARTLGGGGGRLDPRTPLTAVGGAGNGAGGGGGGRPTQRA